METNRDRRFACRTENPLKSPSFSWTIFAIFVLTILHAMEFVDGFQRNAFVPDPDINGSVPTFWDDIAAKGQEKGLDVLESVSEKGTLDRYAESLVLLLGRIVAVQSLASIMSANRHEIPNKVCWVHGKRYGRLLTTDSLSTFCSLPS
jgi:hypothetical protein